jgi:hypothetical protein
MLVAVAVALEQLWVVLVELAVVVVAEMQLPL